MTYVDRVRTVDDGRMVQRTALAEQIAGVCGMGGVVIVAAEAGTGKTVLARQALAQAAGQDVEVHDLGQRPGIDALAALGRALAGRRAGAGAIVASRRDPGLSLDELRATGPVLELDGDDLAWTVAEVAEGLERWGARGDPDHLQETTEGWVAAVRLAALIGEHALSPSSPPLAEYVLRDALAGVPGDLYEAFLRVSFLGTFDEADAAAALAGGVDTTELLARLRRHRLFLHAVAPGIWRVHRLAAAVARRHVAIVDPSLARRLRRHRGGGGGEAHDPQALTDAATADPLLAGHAWELLLDGELTAPSPPALRAAQAGGAAGRLAAALGALATGNAARAQPLLDADAGAGADAGDPVRGLAAVMAARLRADLPAVVHGVEAIEQLPDADLGLRAMALTERGILEFDLGQVDAAEADLAAAAGMAQRAERSAVGARARGALALLCLAMGRLSEATRHADAALAGPPPGFADGRARAAVALALCAYMRDELLHARELSEQARREAADCRDDAVWLIVTIEAVLVAEALGEYDEALMTLAGGREVLDAQNPISVFNAPLLDLIHARLVEHVGRPDEAARLVEAFPRSLDADLALARRHLHEQRPHDAMGMLAPWVRESGVGSPLAGRISWHLVTFALAAAAVHDDAASREAIERALDLTAPERVRRPFAEERIRLRPLLERHLLGETKHGAFVTELLQRQGLDERAAASDARVREPLTERERTVLGYLPSGMTAAEIGAALVVSEATVRTHLRHIYDKLGVAGRREAVQRGAELRYLAQDDAPNRYIQGRQT